jgi:2-methylisocitrate lyase-like PEP mutase family enzyme
MTAARTTTTIHERATTFRALHSRDGGMPFVLPNAWDAMSARVVEEAGARAIATTSAGVAWALGYQDGEGAPREAMLGMLRVIVDSVRIPVTADVERGYGTGTPEDVAETVRGVIAAGAVGINLEDGPGRDGAPLLDVHEQAERIAAARRAGHAEGVELYINARVDPYVRKAGDESTRFDESVRRARLYLEAGADGVFVPLAPTADIGRLAAAIPAPLNVIAGPGSPTIAELGALGVARVSLGPHLARSVMAHVRRAATEVLERGTYESLREQFASPEANALFRRGG